MEKTKKNEDLQKESWEMLVETIIELRKENEQLKKRVHELEIWLEEAIADLQYVL